MHFQQIRSATALIEFAGVRFLVDPMLAPKGTYKEVPFTSSTGRGVPDCELPCVIEELFKVDAVIVTHLHFDHFDYDAIPIVAQHAKKTLFLGPGSCQEKFIEMGIPVHRCRRLDRGERYQDNRILIQAVLADHGSMAPDAIGILMEFAGHRLYFSGDTSFRRELLLDVKQFGPDIAVLSVNGAFGNMNAEEGAAAAELTGAKYAIPCHFWTFMEHGGLPGDFCEKLLQRGGCQPLCFRQGEIRTLQCKTNRERKKETA